MKRVISTLLLAIFLLNTVGYYGAFVGLQAVQKEATLKALDEDEFIGSDAITFRIPLSVPYHTGEQQYERVQGQFEKDGEVFQLVKQKLFRDTLYIVCVKDVDGKKINQELTDYVKTFSDNHDNTKHSSTKKIAVSSNEYIITSVSINVKTSGWIKPIEFNDFKLLVSSVALADIIYPPRIVSFS